MSEHEIPYEYRISSIPDPAYDVGEKQESILAVSRNFFEDRPFKEPKAPFFKKDPFYFAEINKPLFNCLWISWILQEKRSFDLALDPNFAKPWDCQRIEDSMGSMVMKFLPREGRPTISWMANPFVERIVPAFDAYRADIQPTALRKADDSIPEGFEARSFARFRVFGICPISFYDDNLCRSAFGIDSEAVAKRVYGEVPYVKVLPVRNRQGVLIQAVEDYIDVDSFLPIRSRVMAAIRGTATR